ncbi:hypothetical protein ABPG77_005536 [Micractinium sp. CCAP 211/92]
MRIHALACSPAVAASAGFTARVRAVRPAQLARLPTHLLTTRRRARAAPPAAVPAGVQDFVDTRFFVTEIAVIVTLAGPTAILLVAYDFIKEYLFHRKEASQQAAANDAQPAGQQLMLDGDTLALIQGLIEWQIETEIRLAALEAHMRAQQDAGRPADEAADS